MIAAFAVFFLVAVSFSEGKFPSSLSPLCPLHLLLSILSFATFQLTNLYSIAQIVLAHPDRGK